MLSPEVVDKVNIVVRVAKKQLKVWKQWEAGEISWNKTKKKMAKLAHEANFDGCPSHFFLDWLEENRFNFSEGSNGMVSALTELDNIFPGLDELEDDDYDYLEKEHNKVFKHRPRTNEN